MGDADDRTVPFDRGRAREDRTADGTPGKFALSSMPQTARAATGTTVGRTRVIVANRADGGLLYWIFV